MTNRFVFLVRYILLHPSFLLAYAAGGYGAFAAPPGLRHRMAMVLALSAFGSYHVAASALDAVRRRNRSLFNTGRLVVGIGLIFSAYARLDGGFVVEMSSTIITLAGILMVARVALPDRN